MTFQRPRSDRMAVGPMACPWRSPELAAEPERTPRTPTGTIGTRRVEWARGTPPCREPRRGRTAACPTATGESTDEASWEQQDGVEERGPARVDGSADRQKPPWWSCGVYVDGQTSSSALPGVASPWRALSIISKAVTM